MVLASLTRESVKQAFDRGIKASQILRFLKSNVHPVVDEEGGDLVPENVEDQIWLWEKDLKRMSYTEAYIEQLGSISEFEAVRKYSSKIGVLLHSSLEERVVYVKWGRGAEKVRKYKGMWIKDQAIKRAEGNNHNVYE